MAKPYSIVVWGASGVCVWFPAGLAAAGSPCSRAALTLYGGFAPDHRIT